MTVHHLGDLYSLDRFDDQLTRVDELLIGLVSNRREMDPVRFDAGRLDLVFSNSVVCVENVDVVVFTGMFADERHVEEHRPLVNLRTANDSDQWSIS